jgi:glycosyltransferase involved in cell wall biosynthesis
MSTVKPAKLAKRIVFLSTLEGDAWGGSEFLWSEAARRALERGHNVAAVTHECDPQPEPVSRLAAAGASCWAYRRPRPSLARRFAQGVSRRLWPRSANPLPPVLRRVSAWRPDFLCLSQASAYDGAFCPDIVQFLRESTVSYGVICQHSFEEMLLLNEEHRENIAAYFRSAHWVAFVADGNFRKAERELGARFSNVVIVKNPVNLTDLSRVPWPSTGAARFACVARLDARCKGQDLLFEVLAGPCWKERDWRLRLYGAGADRTYLERVSTMYGLDRRIDFAGHVADVRGIWADNHLLVLPSRSEGTPLSLVEAMLCGRPAVVTDVGGNAVWITEPHTGFIAEAPSTRSVAGALDRAWGARDLWPEIGKRAHEKARGQVDPDPGGTLLDLVERAVDCG